MSQFFLYMFQSGRCSRANKNLRRLFLCAMQIQGVKQDVRSVVRVPPLHSDDWEGVQCCSRKKGAPHNFLKKRTIDENFEKLQYKAKHQGTLVQVE